MPQHQHHINPENIIESDAESRLRRLNESGIVAVAYFTTDGRITEANNAFLNMLGVTTEDLLAGKIRWDDYTPKEWMPRTYQAIRDLKTDGIITPYEKQFTRADGTTRWGIFGGAMLPDGKSGISMVLDTTESKNAQEILREAEERHAFLLQLSDALNSLTSARKIQQTASAMVGRYLKVDRVMYINIEGKGENAIAFVDAQFVAENVVPAPARLPYSAVSKGFITEILSKGHALIVNDATIDRRFDEEVRAEWHALKARSVLAIPLVKNGTEAVLFGIHYSKPRIWTEHEIKMVTEVAERTWSAAARADAEEALRERQTWLNGQKQAFQSAMSGQSLAASLQPLIDTIVAQTNGEARGAFYMVPADREGLHLIAGMSEEYARDVNGFKVGPESLACGLAMHTGEPVITPDVELEPLWTPFLSMARKHNYRGCWSFPVYTEGGPTLGTFAMYFDQPREPSQREMDLAEVLAHAAAIIISRHKETVEHGRADEALKRSEERLRATLQSITDAVYIGDISGITLANQPALDQLGYLNYEDLKKNIGTLSVEIQTRDAETNEIISPERQAFARALSGEFVTQNVRIRKRKDGSERILRSAASPVEIDGKIVAAVAVNTDITEQWETAAALHKSEQKLREFNESLEQQVKERTAELRALLLKQKTSEERRQQEIFRAVLDTQEIERKRIAETLHNSLGQVLYAAKLSLGTVDKALVAENDKENLKNADKLLNDAITESRRLSHELMPVILEDFGLKSAIEDICRKLSGKTQFKCRFKGSIKQLDKYVEVAVYRLVQELVMNVINHSEASNSIVAVEVYTDHIVVLVQDDGIGFNALKEKKGGIGLKTIRNNVNLLKGNISITSKAGEGTIINIDIPFKSDN